MCRFMLHGCSMFIRRFNRIETQPHRGISGKAKAAYLRRHGLANQAAERQAISSGCVHRSSECAAWLHEYRASSARASCARASHLRASRVRAYRLRACRVRACCVLAASSHAASSFAACEPAACVLVNKCIDCKRQRIVHELDC